MATIYNTTNTATSTFYNTTNTATSYTRFSAANFNNTTPFASPPAPSDRPALTPLDELDIAIEAVRAAGRSW